MQATLESGRRLEGEVLAPIARWQDVYHSLVVRMRALEKQRLEVDSRRRTVAGLSAKVDAQRAKLGGSGVGGTKAEHKLESTIKLLQHKEGKLSGEGQGCAGRRRGGAGRGGQAPPFRGILIGCQLTSTLPCPPPAVSTQTFQEQEALLHRDLSTLIKDTAWLRNYVSAALAVEGEALSSAAAAFGPMPEAKPAFGKIDVGVPPPEVPTTPVSAAKPAVLMTPPQAREPVEVRKAVSAEQVTNPFSQTI